MKPQRVAPSGVSLPSARKIALAILVAIAVLVSIELAFQVRAQVRTGESVFSLLSGKTSFVQHPTLDVRILRPSSVIKGTRQTITSNRFGLRDEDYEPQPPAGERRIALLGASTIMGAYAPTNAQTSSSALQRNLRARPGMQDLRVVNAGLNGTTLQGQAALLTGLLPTLGVELVVWYPGSNDIGCSAPPGSSRTPPIRLPWPGVPKWALSGDFIVKNTAFLRRNNAASSQNLRPNFDRAAARREIDAAVRRAQGLGMRLVLVTNATSFRSDMPAEEITRRAASSLFFRPCYSGPELARAIDEMNAVLREVAHERNLPLIDAPALLPPDKRYFGDASHFSVAGEEAFAKVIAAELLRQRLLAGEDAT